MLLEREAELAEIARALDEALAGVGNVVVIEGAAGIGKTTLVQAGIERARERGMLVLTARGSELEREFPFGTASQLFVPILEAADEAERRELLSGAARLASPALLLDGDSPASPSQSAAADPAFPILHGLYWLTANLCERSAVLLAVDDVHWADTATLRFLRFLGSRVKEIPLVVALAQRPAEGEATSEVMLSIRADRASRVLSPSALSAAAISELIRARLGHDVPDEWCDAAHEVTGGNPFMLSELVAELEASAAIPSAANAARIRELAPDAVSRSVLLRLARLPQGANELARAVAVLGDGVPLSRAAALAGLDREKAGDLADELSNHDILRPGLPLAFRHPLVRAAIYSDIDPAARAAWHSRAARLLLEEGMPAVQTATHLLETEAPFAPEAIDVLREAARAMVARGAAETPVLYLRRALSEPHDRMTEQMLVVELGAAELSAGDPAAVEHLRIAYESADSGVERAERVRQLAQAVFWAGKPAEGAALLEETISAVAPEHPNVAMRLETELLILGHWAKSLLPTTRTHIERLRKEPVADSTPEQRGRLAALVVSMACRGESASLVRELAGRAWGAGQLLDELTVDSPVFWSLTLIPVYTEDFPLAEHWMNAGFEATRASGSVYGFVMGSSVAPVLALRRGRVIESISHAENCLRAAETHGVITVMPTALGYLIDALVSRGELDRAETLLREHGFDEGELPDTSLSLTLRLNRARLRLARGRIAEAVEDLLEVERRKYEWDFPNPCAHPSGSMAAVALAQLGERKRAVMLAEKDLGLAEQWGTPGAVGIALRALGLAKGGAAGIGHLRDAVSQLERSPLRLDLAQALVDLGAALRRANQRAECREPLRRAHELAHSFGARLLAEQARVELAAAGARPRVVTKTGIDQLTPSELRIAQMAAEGMSNPEIAQALFVTRKTVETHLSSAYRKLEISSRGELAGALTPG